MYSLLLFFTSFHKCKYLSNTQDVWVVVLSSTSQIILLYLHGYLSTRSDLIFSELYFPIERDAFKECMSFSTGFHKIVKALFFS